MKYNYIFDSSKTLYDKEFEIEREKSEKITIFFEKEGVVLTADIHGNATFESVDGKIIKKDKADSSRFFSFIYCIVNHNVITVTFPVTETVDHYPDCDGEFDRYSVKIIDKIIITCPLD